MCAAVPSLAGPAINQFEVKDLESSPGDFEFQSQNAFSTGQPRRRAVVHGGELLADENTYQRQREALELQLGITDWFRVRLGVEYEQERRDEPGSLAAANSFGSLKFTEVALEGVVVFVKPKPEGVGLGLLVEYGSSQEAEPNELFIGPVIEAHSGPWGLIANLTMVKMLGGPLELDEAGNPYRDDKWDFAYFLQGKYEVSDHLAVALEAYGTIDRLGNTGHRSEAAQLFGDHNQHRAGPILYYTMFPNGRAAKASSSKLDTDDGDDDDKELSVTLGAGPLFGLNENTPSLTYKLSLEIDY